MATNLDALAERIYRDGVEKAQDEANEILKKARTEAANILEEARQKSETILKEAEKESDKLKRNVLSDISMAGDQAIIRLKQEIKELLVNRILAEPIKDIFTDKKFIKNLIMSIASSFDDKRGVELTLPESMKKTIDQAMESSLHQEIKDLTIDFNKKLKAGFRIAKKGEAYAITFTDMDFVEFFKPFLNQKTEEVLFKK